MNVKKVGNKTITSYGGDPRISGVQTRIEERQRKFSKKTPIAAGIVVAASALTIALLGIAGGNNGESMKMCTHNAKQENERLTQNWNRRFTQEVVHAENDADATRALNALLVEKQQIERKFQQRAQECAEKE